MCCNLKTLILDETFIYNTQKVLIELTIPSLFQDHSKLIPRPFQDHFKGSENIALAKICQFYTFELIDKLEIIERLRELVFMQLETNKLS